VQNQYIVVKKIILYKTSRSICFVPLEMYFSQHMD
jgi:hypothetical protein